MALAFATSLFSSGDEALAVPEERKRRADGHSSGAGHHGEDRHRGGHGALATPTDSSHDGQRRQRSAGRRYSEDGWYLALRGEVEEMLGESHDHFRDQIEAEKKARQREVESLRRELYGALRREINGFKALEKNNEKKADAAVAEAARAVEVAKDAAKEAAKDAAKDVAKEAVANPPVLAVAPAPPAVDHSKELAAGAALVEEMRAELVGLEQRSNELREMLDQVAVDAKAQVRKVRSAEDNFERQLQVLLRVQEVQQVHQQELKRQQQLAHIMQGSPQAPTYTTHGPPEAAQAPTYTTHGPPEAAQALLGQSPGKQSVGHGQEPANFRSPKPNGLPQPEQEPSEERLSGLVAKRGFRTDAYHAAMPPQSENKQQAEVLLLDLEENVGVAGNEHCFAIW